MLGFQMRGAIADGLRHDVLVLRWRCNTQAAARRRQQHRPTATRKARLARLAKGVGPVADEVDDRARGDSSDGDASTGADAEHASAAQVML